LRTLIVFITTGFILLSGCQTVAIKDADADRNISTANKTSSTIPKSLARRNYQDNGDVWERIRYSMDMPIPDEQLVNQYRQWYIDNPQHLESISQRAKPFLYLIVQEFEHRDLPIELALLPMVESSFNPFAYSSADASGLWQFTSPMASHFGLQMNWWYDGRRDVPAATSAALDMLEYLYKKTDNWLYALAAYNAGEGRLREAIRYNEARGLSTDFWSLPLPKETRQYVPQLLAIADVIKNAQRYGIALKTIPNKPLVEVIDVGSQIDISVAAELANMPIARLQNLNPGFNRWATSPDGPHQLIVPVSKVNEFKKALADTDISARMKWSKYQIKPGDSMSAIAKRYQTTVSKIQQMNDINSDKIVAGKFLFMPHIRTPATDEVALVTAQPTHILSPIQTASHKPTVMLNASKPQAKGHHTVKVGDTLWSIAKVYKVSVDQITSWNNMTDKDRLSVGKTLMFYHQAVKNNI
tara:strand:- start:2788 stop:4197 length:1410 start_codon:yes stop_codon:yes gene_type:complete